jgi:hypothetical protein
MASRQDAGVNRRPGRASVWCRTLRDLPLRLGPRALRGRRGHSLRPMRPAQPRGQLRRLLRGRPVGWDGDDQPGEQVGSALVLFAPRSSTPPEAGARRRLPPMGEHATMTRTAECRRLKYLDNDSRIPGNSMCNVTSIGGVLSFGLVSEPGVYQWHSGSGRRRPQGPET